MSARLLLLALLAAPALAKPVRKPAGAPKRPAVTPKKDKALVVAAFGEVSSVTADAVFLNRGELDGVAPGQVLTFTRGRKATGSCKVSAVSARFARCDGGSGLQPGDRFAVGRVAEAHPLNPAPLPTEAELARRARAVDGVTWQLRDFESGAPTVGGGGRLEALFSHTTFTGGPSGPFGVQRVDLLVHDFELWRGLRASADVTVLNFSARPGETRTVYQQTPVLLVRQLELGFRRADVPFSASLGRTWLRAAPGLMVLDGAQAAWRFSDGFELGAYGGLLPDAARLTITPSQWAAGAFGRVRFSRGEGADATLVQLGLRAGWSLREVLGGRAEVSLLGDLWRGPTFDAHLAVELGFGQTQAVAGVDAARLDLGWRPTETLRFSAGARYRGLPLTGLTEVGLVSPGQRALHSDLGLVWELLPWLYLAGQVGVAADFDSSLWQLRAGPELSMPRLGGLPLSLGLGYQEELGWLRGRYGYLQLAVQGGGFFRVVPAAGRAGRAGARIGRARRVGGARGDAVAVPQGAGGAAGPPADREPDAARLARRTAGRFLLSPARIFASPWPPLSRSGLSR
ncbi:MAG: hypothetical protein ACOZQL_23035 [Myxococcota bacterium]